MYLVHDADLIWSDLIYVKTKHNSVLHCRRLCFTQVGRLAGMVDDLGERLAAMERRPVDYAV